MPMTAKMSDLGSGDAKENRRNDRDTAGRTMLRKRPWIRDDVEKGTVTDPEHVHSECPSCTCKHV